MKAILISIKPKHVANILNGEKTIEIRKKFPKDYVGWVYIYCTKNDYEEVFGRKQKIYLCDMRGKTESGFDFMTLTKNEDTEKFIKDNLNGKVVARFWCDKVEEIIIEPFGEEYKEYELEWCNKSCLSFSELNKYLKGKIGYAWHIDNLVVFDKPKELNDFLIYSHTVSGVGFKGEGKQFNILKPLTRAPESWCYVEI